MLQLALARNDRRFDGQQFAADFRPRKSGDLANAVQIFGLAVAEPAHAQELVEVLRSDADGLLILLVKEHLLDRLAADLRDFALEVTHTGFAGVVTHDVHQRGIGDLQLVILKAVVLHLLRHEVPTPDVHLFVFGITGQTNDFHAVQQRRGDVQAVRGTDKHHLRQVEVDLEIMIVEREVLLRIQHFQQCGRRIAAEVHRHLVDFVQQEQRIVHARLGHVLHDLAGHRADVRAAVAPDFGLVTHAAQ